MYRDEFTTDHGSSHAAPSTLNSEPGTLNSAPSTLNSEPGTVPLSLVEGLNSSAQGKRPDQIESSSFQIVGWATIIFLALAVGGVLVKIFWFVWNYLTGTV